MKLEDLRINNIVLPVDADQNTDLDKYSVCIQGIDNNSMWGESILILDTVNKSTRDVLLKQVKPILITKEVLLKCGFKVVHPEYKNIYAIKNIEYLVGCGDKSGMYWNGYQLPKIKYLHQLQNTYYAITGEELKVDL